MIRTTEEWNESGRTNASQEVMAIKNESSNSSKFAMISYVLQILENKNQKPYKNSPLIELHVVLYPHVLSAVYNMLKCAFGLIICVTSVIACICQWILQAPVNFVAVLSLTWVIMTMSQ